MTSFLPIVDPPNANSRLYDNLYVSSSNSLMSSSRVVTGQSAKISLPSKNFDRNVVTINLPQNMLLGHTTLNLKVRPQDVPAGSYLMPSWGYDAVEYYEYTFADSERLRIDVSAGQLLIKNLADCESGEKKIAVLDFGGESKLGTTVSGTDAAVGYRACISMYLPFSNMSASRVHPFPSDILSRPVQLTIGFIPWLNVLQYANADAAAVRAALLNNDYLDAYLMCKTMYMIDPSDSIKNMVGFNGNEKYLYPYMYPQTFVASRDIEGSSLLSAPMSVQLTRFINGSLCSIDLFLERTTLGNAVDVPTSGTPANAPLTRSAHNSIWFTQMLNARLVYAGQTIWRSDDNTDLLMNLSEYSTPTTFNTIVPIYKESAAGGDIAAVTTTMKSYWMHISLSQYNERFYSNLSQVAPTLHSNEVLFEFTIDPKTNIDTLLPQGPPTNYPSKNPAVMPNYRLHAVMNYSAGCRTAKGDCHLVFQPELSALPSISGLVGTIGSVA